MRRISFSTALLEVNPGDMLMNKVRSPAPCLTMAGVCLHAKIEDCSALAYVGLPEC